jgi:branched-chain amino acid aminotransferase
MIMNECFSNNFILNGELIEAESFDNSLVYEGESIYEVIRLVKGTPVFFFDHMERLSRSIRLQRKSPLAEIKNIRRAIITLTRSERKKEINLKLIFNYKNGKGNWLVYYLDSVYPTEEQNRNGVKGILYHAERKNPESKVINHKLRTSVYQKLIMERGYEALLVNEANLITEGSRSNIFFIKDETLFTAPDNVILGGITRKHILSICEEHNINVEFKSVNADTIGAYDSVFMTGTSPMILPFNSIGNHRFGIRQPVMAKLREQYLIKVDNSIRSFRFQ